MSNLLNLNKTDLDKYIYRIDKIERIINLFSTKKNVLVKPTLWEDPFENFILNSKIRLPTGEIGDFGFRNDFYGQCWTFHKASDAMWRIYSPKKKSVRIRTTIRKLILSLDTSLGDWSSTQSFIGKVKYLPNKQLLHFANTVFQGMPVPEASQFAKTLLVKRPAFEHENEVRLLYFERQNGINSKLFKYTINPHELIDQIMIDPRLAKKEAAETKADLIETTGFKGSVKRSLLYAPPEEMIFPFG